MKSKSTQTKFYLQDNTGKKLPEIAGMTLYKPFILSGAKMWTLTLISGLFFLITSQSFAQTYTSVAPGGNWNNFGTWNPNGVPGAGSVVNITTVGPVTLTTNTASVLDLLIEGLLDAGTFTANGTRDFYVSATATLFVGGTNNFPAGFSTYFINTGSTINYNNDGNQTVKDVSYGNLIFSNSGIRTLPLASFSVAGNFTMRNTVTATLTHPLTVDGFTTLAGTSVLTLGAPEVLSNTGEIILDGGTLRTGATTGNSETVARLTVANPSAIALGTGVHTLTFAASNPLVWSGTSLTITGWVGTPGSSGTAGRIFFGNSASGLTNIQLAKISFTGFPGTFATLLSTGELVPASSPNLAITGVTNHGGSCIGTAAAPITYTITNTGGAAAGVTVTSNNTQFVVSGAPTTIAGGGTATYNVTFTPTSSGAQNATITVASSTTGSNSPTSSLTGTGNGFPTAGLTSSDPDNIICAGNSVTFTATGGTTYEFFINAVSQGAASATATFTTSALTNGQIVTAKVTNTNGCFATSTGITTTVNALPGAPVITGTPSVVVGSTTLLGSVTGGGIWTSSDPTKATINPTSGLVTGIAAGTTTITYTVTNLNGCTNFGTILVTVSTVTGIEDLHDNSGLILINHPNPFSGNTTINYILPSDGQVNLTIYHLGGQVVKTIVSEVETKGDYTINIDTGDLKPGVYFGKLTLKSNGKEVFRVIRLVKGDN